MEQQEGERQTAVGVEKGDIKTEQKSEKENRRESVCVV
jgi:hypothetical protein